MTIELHNNVYCEGEGLPVVLVHGFPVDHRMWDECAEALEAAAVEHGVKRFPIWGPDMPGAGEGPIPSDETSGGKDADGAFPNGLDHMADAYVAMLHEAGTTRRFGRAFRWAAIWFSTFSVCTPKLLPRWHCATRRPRRIPRRCARSASRSPKHANRRARMSR